MTITFMRSNKKLFFILSLLLVSLPFFVQAADLTLAFPPPCINLGIEGFTSCTQPQDIQTYIVRLYQFAVGISGIVAVGMIVYGAILIIVKSENIASKSEGRQVIQDALWGLVLLFASFLLLKTVNPELVKLKEPSAGLLIQTNKVGTIGQTIASSMCNTPVANIKGVSNAQLYGTTPDVKDSCAYRHLFDSDGMVINPVGEASLYYGILGDNIPPKSVVWVYPYFINGSSTTSSVRCLVYAYRTQIQKAANQQLGDIIEKTTMTDLDDDVRPCILDENNKQLSGWDEARGGMASAFASTTQISASAKNINLSYYSGSADCEPKNKTSANGIMSDIKNGYYPYICHDGCKTNNTPCNNTSGKTLSEHLVMLLDVMQFDYENKKEFRPGKIIPRFTVTSLTGGDHIGTNHYSGISADVVAPSKNDTETLLLYLNDKNGVSAYCEYFEDGKFVRVGKTSCGDYGKNSTSKYEALHIHIDYP